MNPGVVAVFVTRPAYVDKEGRSVSGCRFYVLLPELHLFELCTALVKGGFNVSIDEAYWSRSA